MPGYQRNTPPPVVGEEGGTVQVDHYHQKRVLFANKFPGMVCFFIVSCQENIVNRWRRSWFRNKWWGSAGRGGTVSNWCARILAFINSAVYDKSIIYISVFFWNGSSSWETSWSSPLALLWSSKASAQVWSDQLVKIHDRQMVSLFHLISANKWAIFLSQMWQKVGSCWQRCKKWFG